MKYIGITENRLKHSYSVAVKCYEIAKSFEKDEDFCRKMFVIGFNHDIGYMFSETSEKHPKISAELLNLIYKFDNNSIDAIKYHGEIIENKTDEWMILNLADMQVDSKGNFVDVNVRLNDIKQRYGTNSIQYINSLKLCKEINLI